MPQRLSEVGRQYAASLAGAGAATLTPAEAILEASDDDANAGRYIPADRGEPVTILNPPPPLAASASELDALRYALRLAQRELANDRERLAALRAAQERARGDYHAAAEGVAEAEAGLRDAKRFSHQHLVAAYVAGQDTAGVRSEADAQIELDLRHDQLGHSEEIERALRREIADIENGLDQRHRAISDAAGMLVSRSAPFLALAQRVRDAFATLRDVRLAVSEIRGLVTLDEDVCQMIEANQPARGARFNGFATDETLVTEWQAAVASLLTDADAVLPDPGNPRGPTIPRPAAGPAVPARGPGGRFVSIDREKAKPRRGAASPRRRRTGGKRRGSPRARRPSVKPSKVKEAVTAPAPKMVKRPLGAVVVTRKQAAEPSPPPEDAASV